jgi:general secretion pathway protein A
MYESYFGLKASPFNMTPDPDAMFWTPAHREALAGLTYAVTCRKGFAVLSGPAGTGKTTLLRKLLQSSPVPMAASFVYNPTVTSSEFLEMALTDFGIPQEGSRSKAQQLFHFEQFLLSAYREGRTAVLIVDEAHKLSPEVLEEIRLLTNFETANQKLLQIVLAGQPELNDILNCDDLLQLKQRVAANLRTRRLTRPEVTQYLEFRWTKMGGSEPLPFTRDAIDLIYDCTEGIPRMINGICDNALISAYGSGRRMVGREEILDVARDLDLRVPVVETPKDVVETPKNIDSAAAPAEVPAPSKPKPVHFVPAANQLSGFIRIPFRTEEQDEPEPQSSMLGRLAGRFRIRFGRSAEIAK